MTAKANSTGTKVVSSLSDFDLNAAKAAAAGASYAFVFINADSGEDATVEGNEGDRNNLTAWHGGDALVNAVASVNKNTVCCISRPPLDVS
jgi:beta-glucosidase